ncbi:flagellar hook-basal body protein [Paenibacillus sp. N1-5-1-14]|uniref:flagellar hook-basal body protein n=1 Tax=Paenibacillus radicibacter TaxID=2972488 RepID=UPI0021591E73|nr:flagellar hook-basal body protein [Paenibacillus radicibacter]MCR8645070.1 flagellar hook-basal body protein [Paenibacillus radicibacter]
MLRGLYTAAGGMITQQRTHDTVTNNIANINTPGFKQGYSLARSFPQALVTAMGTDEVAAGRPNGQLGRLTTGVFAEENVSIYGQGDLEETNNPYDFALQSNIQVPGMQFDSTGKSVDENGTVTFQPHAFFTMLDASGQRRYSLNGKFTVNDAGELTNASGNRLVDQTGAPIVLRDAAGEPLRDFKVTDKGIFVDRTGEALLDANGDPLRLLITKAENPNLLMREGNGLYAIRPEDEGTLTQVLDTDVSEVRQGYIERSNVDPTQAMVDMMTAQRAYEANQKVIQFYDRSLEKAVNEIGRI